MYQVPYLQHFAKLRYLHLNFLQNAYICKKYKSPEEGSNMLCIATISHGVAPYSIRTTFLPTHYVRTIKVLILPKICYLIILSRSDCCVHQKRALCYLQSFQDLDLPAPNRYESDLSNEVLWRLADQRTANLQAFKVGKTGDGHRASLEHNDFS